MYTDEKFLILLKQNKEKAAQILVEQYTPLLHSICASQLTNLEDVNECVNDTFAEFLLHHERYDASKSSLKNYLCTIAKRKSIDKYRKNRRRSELERELREKYKEASIISTVQSQDAHRLEEAMEKLSDSDRQLLRMHYYDDMSYKEISQELNINYETVKKKGLRLKKKLLYILLLCLLALAITACTSIVLKKHGLLPTWFPFYDMIPGEVPDEEPEDNSADYDIHITDTSNLYDNEDDSERIASVETDTLQSDSSTVTTPEDLSKDSASINILSTPEDKPSSGKKYQFSSKKGIIWSDSPTYELVENTQKFTIDDASYELENVLYQNGHWEITFRIAYLNEQPTFDQTQEYPEEEMAETLLDFYKNRSWLPEKTIALENAYLLLPTGEKIFLICDDSIIDPDSPVNKPIYLCEFHCDWTLPENRTDTLHLSLVLPTGDTFDISLKKLDVREYIQNKDIGDSDNTENEGTTEESGNALATTSTVVTLKNGITSSDNGTTIVNLTQENIGEYLISDLITQSYWGFLDHTAGVPILLDKDGNEYSRFRSSKQDIDTANGKQREFEIYFRNIEPGEYTLKIPSLGLEKEAETDSVRIPLPTGADTYISCNLTVFFPDGAGLHITGVERTEAEWISYDGDLNHTFLVPVTHHVWYYKLIYETISPDENVEFCLAIPKGKFSNDTEICSSLKSQNGEPGYFLHTEDSETPEYAEITFYHPLYYLDQEFLFDITITE